MKVAYIQVSSNAEYGSSRALKTMLSGLMQQGIEPLVVLPDAGELMNDMQAMGVKCAVVPFRRSIYPTLRKLSDYILYLPHIIYWAAVNALAVRRLAKILRSEHIELVHTNVSVVDIGFRAAQRCGISHVYHIREYAPLIGMHFFPSRSCFERQLNTSPRSYAITITRDIASYYHLEQSPRCSVIYDGIRQRRTSLPPRHVQDYVLFAGRIEYIKGLDIVLQAYAICRERGQKLLPLRVAGRVQHEDYYAELTEFIAKHDLSDAVTFLGERTDIEDLMSEARALVVSSRNEGFGLCMPEAMFVGCPVIAHDTAGTHEQLQNGLAATGQDIAMPFTTVEQLADLLAEVSSEEPEHYQPMATRAFSVVNDLYTTEATTAGVLQLYQRICDAS